MRGTIHLLLLGLLSTTLVATESDSVIKDASVPRVQDRPILIRLKAKYSGKLMPSGKPKASLKMEKELELIDDHQDVSADEPEATRTIKSYLTRVNRDITDPVFVGIEIKYEMDDNRMKGTSTNDMRIPKPTPPVLRLFPTVGLPLELPEKLHVGQDCKVDLVDIASALILDGAAESATAELNVKSYDEKSGVLVLKGPLVIKGDASLNGVKGHATYTLKCDLRVKVSEQRIASLALDGDYDFSGGEGSKSLLAKTSYKAKLTTEIGKGVEKARKRKHKYRNRHYQLDRHGLQLSLPSYYEHRLSNRADLFVSHRGQGNEPARFQIRLIKGDTKQAPTVLNNLEASLVNKYDKAEAEKVSSSLGPGRAITFYERQGEEETRVRLEFFPHRAKQMFVQVAFQAAPLLYKEHSADFDGLRKSLKAFKPR